MGKKSRKEKKQKERRESRETRLQRQQAKARARRRRKAIFYVVVVAAAAGIGYGAFGWLSRDLPGESVASQGNNHLAFGAAERFPYNTDPPTSGPHYTGVARWGVHKRPIPKGLQVHNLEDGGVLVQYRCRDCPDLIRKIEDVVSRYSTRVIAAPYPGMKPLIALTAWGRIDRLDAFDEKRIVAFIEAYRGIDHHRR
ncbi:MAG: DUF3105 domain-containing protein [Nitrospinota bacterium]